MKTVKSLLAGLMLVLFAAAPTANAQPDGGAFSAYLVGTFENRLGVGTMIQVVNPTTADLQVVIAFFNETGTYLTCVQGTIRPNGMKEVLVPINVPRLSTDHGVVKIISHLQGEVKRGIVGFQAKVSFIQGQVILKTMSESLLASVPTAYAQDELNMIMALCP